MDGVTGVGREEDHSSEDGVTRPRPGDSAARVSRDMQGIFGAAPAGPRRPAASPLDPIAPRLAPERRAAPEKRTRTPLLLGIGACVGLAIAWTVAPPGPAPTPALRAVEAARPLAPLVTRAPIQAPAAPLPVAPVPAPAVSEPTAMLAMAPSEPVATPEVAPTGRKPRLRQAALHAPVRKPAARHRSARMRMAADVDLPCTDYRGLARARCMRPEILAADRRLRHAYADASRAGVDRDMLVSYRNRWNRLRGQAISDPIYVADSYQRMAERLEAARYETVDY